MKLTLALSRLEGLKGLTSVTFFYLLGISYREGNRIEQPKMASFHFFIDSKV